jgi:hypothetical protein
MTEREDARPEVSFVDVASQDPEQSVAHETDSIDDGGAETDGQESTNDTPPGQPTVSSLISGGPVGDGDELAP